MVSETESRPENESAVLEAAEKIVRAFGEGRVADYFSLFAEDATFVFYTENRRLESRDEYRKLWERLEREDDFKVLSCTSGTGRVQNLGGDVAVFTHDVETRVSTRAGEETLHERETIVFRRGDGGKWLAAHEHLSPQGGGE